MRGPWIPLRFRMEGIQGDGKVCRIPLPEGLQDSSRLPEPIYTPATKAQSGHDINIGFDETVNILGAETAGALRDLTLEIYKSAADHALKKGIIIADTKFEFGRFGENIILCDEVLTPDSSRFWPMDDYQPGGPKKAWTSNTCAITSKRSSGIKSRRPRNFPRKSSRERLKSIGTFTVG